MNETQIEIDQDNERRFVPGFVFGPASLAFAVYYSYLLIYSTHATDAAAAPLMQTANMPGIYLAFEILVQFIFPAFCFWCAAKGTATLTKGRVYNAVFVVLLADMLLSESQLPTIIWQVYTGDLMVPALYMGILIADALMTVVLYGFAAASFWLAARGEANWSRRCILLAFIFSILQMTPYTIFELSLASLDARAGAIYILTLLWMSIREYGSMLLGLSALYALMNRYARERSGGEGKTAKTAKKPGTIAAVCAAALLICAASLILYRQESYGSGSGSENTEENALITAWRNVNYWYQDDVPADIYPVRADSERSVRFVERDAEIRVLGCGKDSDGINVVVAEIENRSKEVVHIYSNISDSAVNGCAMDISFNAVVDPGQTVRVKMKVDGAQFAALQSKYIESALLTFSMSHGADDNLDYNGPYILQPSFDVPNTQPPALYGVPVYGNEHFKMWYQGKMTYEGESYLVFYIWTDDRNFCSVQTYRDVRPDEGHTSQALYPVLRGNYIPGEGVTETEWSGRLLDKIDETLAAKKSVRCNYKYIYFEQNGEGILSFFDTIEQPFSFEVDPSIAFPGSGKLIDPQSDFTQSGTPEAAQPAADAISILEELRSFRYTYSNGAGYSWFTTVEPDPGGGYVIEKDSPRLMSPIAMYVSDGQYLELTELFDDYDILELSPGTEADLPVYRMELSVFSASGGRTDYCFNTDDYSADYANPELGEFYEALEEKYESFGEWSFTKNEYEVIPLTELDLIEQRGNATTFFKIADEQEEFALSQETIDREKIPVNKDHMVHIHLVNEKPVNYSLNRLTKAERLELSSIASKLGIWSAASLSTEERKPGDTAPKDYYYLGILIQRENGGPMGLVYTDRVPPECAEFVKIIDVIYCDIKYAQLVNSQ